MLPLDDILSVRSEADFRRAAMELFEFQARECAPYREYIALCGIDARRVREPKQIPFMPIGLWRSHRVYCGDGEPEIVFTSSTTGGTEPSRHFMAFEQDYRATFRRAFELFYPGRRSIYALLPNYLQRTGSSLVFMADDLIRRGGGGFYLDDHDALLRDMAADRGGKILLGVSYALWELAERGCVCLENTTVMETGGMKGRREELPKEEFHALLCNAFGVSEIASEYGMAELSSQAYSSGRGIFRTPPWMRVLARDINDPFSRPEPGRSGGLDIIDLANRFSCAFVQTDDVGRVWPEGSLEILGRIDHSVARGCNLLVD
ncbi:MAG: acyltransferase [Rikenellaceae bacterium]|jgi:hypothetical protein|nr:acyltransferase [Rikenellaceae bacterium]